MSSNLISRSPNVIFGFPECLVITLIIFHCISNNYGLTTSPAYKSGLKSPILAIQKSSCVKLTCRSKSSKHEWWNWLYYWLLRATKTWNRPVRLISIQCVASGIGKRLESLSMMFFYFESKCPFTSTKKFNLMLRGQEIVLQAVSFFPLRREHFNLQNLLKSLCYCSIGVRMWN